MSDRERPTLFVLTGLPGAGKSTRAAQIVADTGAVHVSMDDELVKRGVSIVDFESRFRIQQEVEASIPPMLEAGHSVVAEFGSWSREERTRIAGLGRSVGAQTELHWLDAPVEVLQQRIRDRGGEGAETLATTVLVDGGHMYERPTAAEGAEYSRYVPPNQ